MAKNDHASHLVKLGQFISKERQKKGITLEELATQMDISKGNLSDIENGKRDPRFTTLRAISKGLGLRISQLLKEF